MWFSGISPEPPCILVWLSFFYIIPRNDEREDLAPLKIYHIMQVSDNHTEMLQGELQRLFKAKLEKWYYRTGDTLADRMARAIYVIIASILIIGIYLALNVALALYLGKWVDSYALGFIMLAGIYLLLFVIWLLAKRPVINRLKNNSAASVLKVGEQLHASLNGTEDIDLEPETSLFNLDDAR